MVLTGCAALAVAVGVIVPLAWGTDGSNSGGSSLRLIGPAPGSARIGFALVLRLPRERQLRSFLAAIENPRSPRFRHFIEPGAFGRRFGISSSALAALATKVRGAGLTVTASYPQRTELDVSATVQTIERLFSVRLLSYRDAAGRRFYAPVGEPKVPAAFKPAVQAATGLDTRPRLVPHDVPFGGLTPSVAATAYDVAALHAAGISGQGQTIAVISFSAFAPSDPAAYAHRYAITGPAPRVVAVDGGTTNAAGASEADLDIEVIRAIAPEAQILFYEAPNNTSEYARMINQIVKDRSAQIISSSWGQCELGVSPQERAGLSAALSSAVAAGITMFVATGDSGAYDCQKDNPADHTLSVDWPADSVDAVAVGGTRLYLAANGAYQKETAWEDQLSDAGGGGGFSQFDPRPSWQSGPGVLDTFSNGHRQLPDVSAVADPGTGWAICTSGICSGGAGGTSAAAPFWSAAMLLVQQYAAGQGVGRLGFVDPILYALASATQPFPPFHQITEGTNRFYPAAPGWNPATGLGSPDVYNLARDMVAYLRAHRP